MISGEEELLTTLEDHGFDFTSTVREIEARFPKELEWGVPGFQVLPYRLLRPLAGLGEIWKIPITRDVEFDLPPTRYQHSFHRTDDAKGNHNLAVAVLTPLLGGGKLSAATNVYGRCWRVGFFEIRVTTWPRELNRSGHNAFQGKDPYLWTSANVTIEPDFPFVRFSEDVREPLKVLLKPGNGYVLECRSAVYGRRNKSRADEGMVGGLADSDFVIRGLDRSVRVALAEIQKVSHARLTPGRFSGGSSLALNALFIGKHQVSVPIATGEQTASLDQVARHLAERLGRPLSVEEYSDEG